MPKIPGSVRNSFYKAKLLSREVGELSPATMRAIVANTLRMQRQDRRDRAVETSSAVAVTPGRFLSAAGLRHGEQIAGLTGVFERADVEVEFFAPDVVRISWGPDDEPVPWATEPAFDLPPIGEIDLSLSDEVAVARTTHLRVEVGGDGVHVFDSEGNVRYHELPPLRRGPVRVLRRVLAKGEQIYGFGEQAGPSDRRGRTLRLWNRDPGGAWGPDQDELYCAIPVSLVRSASGSVMAFHENPFDAQVKVETGGDGGAVEIRFSGGMVRTWVAVGDDVTALRRYAGLTGKPPMPPRWALGYHHSRWGFRDLDEVESITQEFSHRGIPLSGIHLDIDHMDDFRVFTIDDERFGGLEEFSERIASNGTRIVTIVDPGIAKDEDFDLYEQARADGHLVENQDGTVVEGTVWPGWAVFPDFTAAKTRRWWASLYPRLLDRGVSGIWHDMNEPTSITLSGDRTLPRSARHDNNGRGGDHREVHNVYGMLMNRAGREGMRAHRPDRRPFIVSRAGWAGMQRHAWNWTADVQATKAGLSQQLPTFLGLSISGVSLTGSDVGGFNGHPSPELFVRWMELGVVSPFFRTHSVIGMPPREPWRWPSEVTEQVASLIALRYRLLPYFYTTVEKMTRDGSPFLRPVWWNQPSTQDSAVESDDVALVGPDLLYVLATGSDNEAHVVALPPGDWWRWATVPGMTTPIGVVAEHFTGGETYEFTAPLGQPMFFVRGGAILPLDDAWRAPSRPSGGLRVDHAPQRLAFHVFPDHAGVARGEHYDDDGDGDGPSRRDLLVLDDDILTWTSEGERIRPASIDVVIYGRVLRSAIADGTPVPPGSLSTDGTSTTIHVDAFRRLKLS